jgi:heat shock protein HslJ
MKIIFVFLLSGLLLLTACLAADEDAENNAETVTGGLDGTEWMLTAYGADDDLTAVLPDSAVTAKFVDVTMVGSAGCNSYNTTFVLDGRSFSVNPILVTEMACMQPGVMEQEAAFLAALSTALSYERIDALLTIVYGDGVLHFVPQQSPPSKAFEGTIWQLEMLEQHNGEVVTGMPFPEEMVATAVFADGQISGSSGCNSFGAPYRVNGNLLTIDTMTKTEAICPTEVQILAEGLLFNGLALADSFTIIADQLTISYPSGTLIFRAQTEIEAMPQSDTDAAQQTLIAFFDHLRNGRYAEAAALYNGSYDVMIAHNPDVDPNDHAGLMQQACMVNGAICLEVDTAVFTEQPAPNEFDYLVEFANADGTLFTIVLPEQSAQSQFPFTVQVTEPGSYRVLTPLAYAP